MNSNKPLDSHHAKPPQDTLNHALQRLKLLEQDIFLGIEEIGHLDTMGLPVYRVACAQRANEWGKGATIAQCQASAVMERVERYSSMASSHENKQTIRDSFNNLHDAISRNAFGLTNLHRVFYTEEKIDSMQMDWVQAQSLIDNKKKWVPAQWVFFRYPLDIFWDVGCTTGLASGNMQEEAIHHALCEVMERHQLHVNTFNRPPLRQIDLSTVENPALKQILSDLKKKGFVVIANDLSGNWKLSTVSVFIYHPHEHIANFTDYFHLGTSSDPEIALIRAITEAAQYRAIYRFVGNEIMPGNDFFGLVPSKVKDTYQWITKDPKKISMQEVTKTAGSPKKEIEIAVKDINEHGFDALFFDHTHPALQIPVVRVLVPGLQPNFLMHNYHHHDKKAIVTPHLSIYESVIERCKNRQLRNQKLDEIVAL